MLDPVPRKTCIVFFIIDASASMAGIRIGAFNSAIEQTLEKFKEINADSADAEIEIAILTFSSGARWLTPNGSVKVEYYYWNDLTADESDRCDMGEAFRLLEEKLHRGSGFMQKPSLSYAPILHLITDGEPTDDYKKYLTRLQNNRWFKVSLKIALAVGDDANDAVLMEFTGSKESVVRVADGVNAGEKLKKMIQFIAVAEDNFYAVPVFLEGEILKKPSFHSVIHAVIPDNNALWQALQRIQNECGEDIFLSFGKFKSALADFMTGIGQNIVRLRKRTVEAVELGVYKRLKKAEQFDLERVVRVEIKKLRDEGIDETTAKEIVYALAKFLLKATNQIWYLLMTMIGI